MRPVVLLAVAVVTVVTALLVWPVHPDAAAMQTMRSGVQDVTGHRPTTSGPAFWTTQTIGNIVVFLPVGWVVSVAARRWWAGAVFGVLLSCLVETVQLFEPGRVSSLNDVLVNSVGAVLGSAVAAFWLRRTRVRAAEAEGRSRG